MAPIKTAVTAQKTKTIIVSFTAWLFVGQVTLVNSSKLALM